MLSSDDYVKCKVPEINLDKDVKIVLNESSTSVSYQRYPSSSVSSSSLSFNNINPPSGCVTSRRVLTTLPMRLRFEGDNVPNNQFLFVTDGLISPTGSIADGNDALRAFPLSQITKSVNVKINNQSFTQSLNEYIEPLMRYNGKRDISEQIWSSTPTMQDEYQQYNDFTTFGSSRNSIGNYGENGYRTPRGGFCGLVVREQGNSSGGGASTPSTGLTDIMYAIVDVQVCEYLYLSPLMWDKIDERGLYGLQTMNVTYNFDSNILDKIWSHNLQGSGNKTINSVRLSFNDVQSSENGQINVSQPEILFKYYSISSNQMVPERNIYPYNSLVRYQTEANSTLVSGGTQTSQINTIQLNSIPKYMLVWVDKSDSTKTLEDTDTYCRINSINLNFSNQNGILSDASTQHLFQIASNNGVDLSYTQWSKFVGSPLLIDFSKDVSLHEGDFVGLDGSYNLSYKVSYTNLSNQTRTMDINTLIISEGYITLEKGYCHVSSSLGNVADLILASDNIPEIDREYLRTGILGAGVYENVKDALVKVMKQYGPQVGAALFEEIPVVGKIFSKDVEKYLRELSGGKLTKEQYLQKMRELKAKSKGHGMVAGGVVAGGRPAGKQKMKKTLKRY